MRAAVFLSLVAAIAALSCAGSTVTDVTLERLDRMIGDELCSEAVPELERLAARHPGRLDLRWRLLRCYRTLAMDARKANQLREYTDYLTSAYEEGIAMLKLRPEHPGVHFELALIAAYQGDLKRAYRGFQNSRKLAPRWPDAHLAVAETLVYRGKVGRARGYIKRARRLGAHPGDCEIIELLAAWRFGDFMEVNELFDAAYELNPEIISNWSSPDEPIESWEDFRLHCCSLPYCGPYMVKGCPPGVLKAVLESVDPETRRRELVLEMMRRREMEKIYADRRDLEIVIEDPDEIELPPEEEASSRD